MLLLKCTVATLHCCDAQREATFSAYNDTVYRTYSQHNILSCMQLRYDLVNIADVYTLYRYSTTIKKKAYNVGITVEL